VNVMNISGEPIALFTLKTEVPDDVSPEALLTFYQATRHHISDDSDL
jgi:hypothetical protein